MITQLYIRALGYNFLRRNYTSQRKLRISIIMAYSSGFLHAMGWNRRALSLLGAWPEINDTIFDKFRALCCGLWISFVVCIPLTASMTIFWGDLDAMIGCLFINGPVMLAVVKILIFLYYRREIRILIEEMNHDWYVSRNKEEHDSMMKFGKISRFISICSVILGSTLLISFIIFQIYSGMTLRNQPNNFDPRLSVGLLYPVYLPYNTDKKATFVPTWMAQCITTIFSITMYAGFDAFFSTVILHVCGQLAVVGLSIRNLYSQENSLNIIEFQKQFSNAIKRHQELNNLVNLIDVLSSPILLPQMILCTIVFCFQGYMLLNSILEYSGFNKPFILQTLFMVIYICYTVLHLFVYCYVEHECYLDLLRKSLVRITLSTSPITHDCGPP
uniref:Odorant receptor n=1 Tax=Aulacocentrum confusum TaxID=2767324 RepID=A0A7G8Z962_9HYME|nr:olfactory receptor 43 [Aulacocentrum confusum]